MGAAFSFREHFNLYSLGWIFRPDFDIIRVKYEMTAIKVKDEQEQLTLPLVWAIYRIRVSVEN